MSLLSMAGIGDVSGYVDMESRWTLTSPSAIVVIMLYATYHSRRLCVARPIALSFCSEE